MKKFSLAFGSLIALAAVAAPAQAQNLNWYGLNACFAGAVGSSITQTNTVSSGNCGNYSSSSITFDNNDSNNDKSSLTFTRATPPGGPGDQGSGDPVSLAFGSIGSSQSFNLGRIQFNNDRGTSFDYAFLNFSLFFDASTTPAVSLNNQFKLDYSNVDCGWNWNCSDASVSFSNPSAVAFSVGNANYEFKISGLEYGDVTCSSVDIDLPYTHNGSLDKNVCGKVTYKGTTNVPEPSSVLLTASALVGLVGFARRRNRNA